VAPESVTVPGRAEDPMLTLYHAPRTRSVRIVWLLEELGLEYALEKVDFSPPTRGYSQATPLGKIPVLVDDDGTTMCESGAIIEYVLERYGEGRLGPPVGSPDRGRFLQWLHFAEGTAYPPLGVLILHRMYLSNADAMPEVMQMARERARAALEFLKEQMGEGPWVMGSEFTGADVMLGFDLVVARAIEVLEPGDTELLAYLGRLESRPAFERAMNA
jgi:glutathione S-transferase